MSLLKGNSFLYNNITKTHKSFNKDGKVINYIEYSIKDSKGNIHTFSSGKTVSWSKFKKLIYDMNIAFAISPTGLLDSFYVHAINAYDRTNGTNIAEALRQIDKEQQEKNRISQEFGESLHKEAETGVFDEKIPSLGLMIKSGMARAYREDNGLLMNEWVIPSIKNDDNINNQVDHYIFSYMPDAIYEINEAFIEGSNVEYNPLESRFIIIDYKATRYDYSYNASRQLNFGALQLAKNLTNNRKDFLKVYNNIDLYLIELQIEVDKATQQRSKKGTVVKSIIRDTYDVNIRSMWGEVLAQEAEEMRNINHKDTWSKSDYSKSMIWKTTTKAE